MFNKQLNKNIIAELLFTDKYIKYIKGALIIVAINLENKLKYKDQREIREFLVLAKSNLNQWTKEWT